MPSSEIKTVHPGSDYMNNMGQIVTRNVFLNKNLLLGMHKNTAVTDLIHMNSVAANAKIESFAVRITMWMGCVSQWVNVCKSLLYFPQAKCDEFHMGINRRVIHAFPNPSPQAFPQLLSVFSSVNNPLSTVSTQLTIRTTN